MGHPVIDISRLSVAERLDLAKLLWTSIAQTPEEEPAALSAAAMLPENDGFVQKARSASFVVTGWSAGGTARVVKRYSRWAHPPTMRGGHTTCPDWHPTKAWR